ncbi:hypothetical protein TVAG_111990 [Trichomonas vaginalis G3]|uniref:Uncharacterized protein n=1 Tax=Trichomonas vaginalis (strain ATCC PRA-98 / G3) TaxID=412133 RepID=A2G4G1_TRIV3|nr:OST3 / OST6 family, transporter family [Trichomonas vaginalis G3]EAX87964.1 hypothetical protein TVAG_111990 [Trichomonas vaginalis G3]KAI5542471.1 OST3 / OST6 family, transporter family [Trichomonas vaginalis G3]|eukprot:XP_001300894.1 hypothetical protein [Trichomonas vaginalis G3]
MKFKDAILAPIKHFNVPDVKTPLSTIPIPPLFVCMAIVCVSFFVIIGGFIYCIIRDVEFISAARGPDGKVVPVVIAGGYTQTGIESFIVGAIFTIGGIALTSGFRFLHDRNQSKKVKKQDDLDFNGIFGLTALMFIFLMYLIFVSKMGTNVLRFTSR